MINLEPYAQTLNGKPVAVYGLGLSGLACVRALVVAGVRVVAWDDTESKRADALKAGAEIDMLENLEGFSALVLSPGIPLHFPQPHPVVERARASGVEIIGDVELFHRTGLQCKTIGITGTNGKSTTTALLGHILKNCGIKASVGGNIGQAVLDLDMADVFVLELSSYQLDLCSTFAPDIAVHMNLTPDHIDRHKDLQGYMAAKMRIFRGAGYAVIGSDDKESCAMMDVVRNDGQRDIYPVSTTRTIQHGAFVENGVLFDAIDNDVSEITNLDQMTTLPGLHNHQNIAAAYTVSRLMGLTPDDIVAAIKTYPGLPHRMFMVRKMDEVLYVNDSKATNADAAGKALACYRNIHWILGGKPKSGGLDGLDALMDRIAHAYVIGEAAEDFSVWLAARGVAVTKCGTLDLAVLQAHKNAQSEPPAVVLLSPACASFDQFNSFEHRGEVFTQLVKGL